VPSVAVANAESGEELEKHARWYAKLDTAGSTLVQPAAAPFSPGGAKSTQRAARITGTLTSSADAFAALVLVLAPNAAAALGSPMIGVSFWGKQGSTSGGKLRVSATTTDATAFGVDLPLYGEWAEYMIPFRALKPATSNGPPTLDATRIERIEWRVTGAAAPYDVFVDEVSSFGCIGDTRPSWCSVK
jgi:hypothetical protein